jgi:hypothetical protein
LQKTKILPVLDMWHGYFKKRHSKCPENVMRPFYNNIYNISQSQLVGFHLMMLAEIKPEMKKPCKNVHCRNYL